MIIYGGYNGTNVINDLWEYSITNNYWTQLTSSTPIPSPRFYHSAIYSPQTKSMIIFGGVANENVKNGQQNGIFLNDLWGYDIPNNIWNQLNPSGLIPSTRASFSAIYKEVE